ncbi:hypothetical protein SGFS_054060 [Streptomyces graminofaciens]|uniref:Uncharacterized protein n=1 Tax=Streptomyces graminofaciens TaxID=68212 RepID=A0ABN5VPJ5_9ACTN|nr:hypothetical protein SGFS_054060 [Streptomyces graminofaciens]
MTGVGFGAPKGGCAGGCVGRVLRGADEIGYRPDNAARLPRSNGSGTTSCSPLPRMPVVAKVWACACKHGGVD